MKPVSLFEGSGNILAPLDLLAKCEGYYKRKPGGPLVGYAGKYNSGDGTMIQYVGEEYANFAKAERHVNILDYFAGKLLNRMWERSTDHLVDSTGFCGAPEGGKALACSLALEGSKRGFPWTQYIYPEKKVLQAASPSGREVSNLQFDRHEPEEGEIWWIVEDVCNNFSTTRDLVAIIESFGATVAGIVCFLNRSLEIDTEFSPREGLVLPVISLVRKKIPQYRQDDPMVAADIAAGNVVWKPKNEWHRLK